MKKRQMLKKICIFAFMIIINLYNYVQASTLEKKDEYVNDTFNNYDFTSYINEINNYSSDVENQFNINLENMTKNILKGKGISMKDIFSNIVNVLFKEIFSASKSIVLILIIIIVMAIFSALQLEKDSEIASIVHIVCFIVIATISIGVFKDVIYNVKDMVSKTTNILQISSPFVLAILIGTGAISSSSIIEPTLLFISSFIGNFVNAILIPGITISFVLNIISTLSENLSFFKVSDFINKAIFWGFGIVLTLFLGILSLETTLTSSVDSVALDVTEAAVSNFVPVVGKFFSDSFEMVVSSSKIIAKAYGIIGIIVILITSFTPIIKITGIFILYTLVLILCSIICKNEKIEKFLEKLANIYKTLIGVLVGVDVTFIISIGIMINLCSKISN